MAQREKHRHGQTLSAKHRQSVSDIDLLASIAWLLANSGSEHDNNGIPHFPDCEKKISIGY
jgi:hypothetical protein